MTHVNMGDLFDKRVVPFHVILEAYRAYKQASERFSNVSYFVIVGNHDVSRDFDIASAMDIFTKLVEPLKNVTVVSGVHVHQTPLSDTLAFAAFHPFKDSTEQSKELKKLLENKPAPVAVFGHWDTESYGQELHNMLPYSDFDGWIPNIVTGHVHLPSETTLEGGSKLIVTGSMQPYTFAEDPEGKLYVTHDLLTVEGNLDEDELYYENKCLRIRLAEGEEMPEIIEALQIIPMREGVPGEDEDISVNLLEFSLEEMVSTALVDEGVSSPTIQQEIQDLFTHLKEESNHG